MSALWGYYELHLGRIEAGEWAAVHSSTRGALYRQGLISMTDKRLTDLGRRTLQEARLAAMNGQRHTTAEVSA